MSSVLTDMNLLPIYSTYCKFAVYIDTYCILYIHIQYFIFCKIYWSNNFFIKMCSKNDMLNIKINYIKIDND